MEVHGSCAEEAKNDATSLVFQNSHQKVVKRAFCGVPRGVLSFILLIHHGAVSRLEEAFIKHSLHSLHCTYRPSKTSKSIKNSPQSCPELKNPDVRKLKDWHPTSSGNVYSANDCDVGRDDPALPDGPTTKFRPSSLTWRRTLSRPRYNSVQLQGTCR